MENNTSFSYWINEVADIPTQYDDGEWYDAEDGFSYKEWAAAQSTVKAKRTVKKASEKTLSARSSAKKFGGKALKGSAAQKKWAEQIRADIINSDKLDESQLKKLVTIGGFTDHSKFWIENRDVDASKFIAENIVSQYRGLLEAENKNRDTLSRTSYVSEIEKSKNEIRNYLKSCDFKFESNFSL